VGLLRTVICRGCVAICPGVTWIVGPRGSRVVKGRRGVGGRIVVVTRIHGAISRRMGAAEEGGFGHPAMVDGGIWSGVEGRGRVSLGRGVPELVVGCAHGLRQVYRIRVVGRLWGREGGVVIVYHLITFVWDVDRGDGNVECESRGGRLWQETEHSRRSDCEKDRPDERNRIWPRKDERRVDAQTYRETLYHILYSSFSSVLKKYNIIIEILRKCKSPLVTPSHIM
jgi:hypothetical protein